MINKKLIHCDDIRKHIKIVDGFVVTPDESEVDIFSVTSKEIKKWEPEITLPEYKELSKIYLDIETVRINKEFSDIRDIAEDGEIMMIGLRNEKGRNIILRGMPEKEMLIRCFEIIKKKKPDLILTFNGTRFDLPYIRRRAEIWGLQWECPFWINYDRESSFGAARIAGRPWDVEFRPVYCKVRDGHLVTKINHIDCYQAAIGYDSVLRKFTKYTLKSLPIQLGLRDEERLDLGIEGIEHCYHTGDWETLDEYLIYDLEDTELLGDFLMPSIYYQQVYFPEFSLQQLVTLGNATKWNSILKTHYGYKRDDVIEFSDRYDFQGAITDSIAGVHQDVAGCDFSGQYPSSMLQYGIHSNKDPECFMLSVMENAVLYRAKIKYDKNATQVSKDLSTAVKPVINSAYGSLAAYSPFGDSIAAAIVTLMARARLKWGRKFVEAMGGKVVLCYAGETEVLTEFGSFPISTLVGKNIKVLNRDSDWVYVKFENYGKQPLYEVTLYRKGVTKSIRVTASHKWLVSNTKKHYDPDVNSNHWHIKTTRQISELCRLNRTRFVPFILAKKPPENQNYYDGIIHGLIYCGVGCILETVSSVFRINDTNYREVDVSVSYLGTVRLHLPMNDKNTDELNSVLQRSRHIDGKYSTLPKLEETNSYLLGFFRVMLALRANIGASSIQFRTTEKDRLFLQKISSRLGFSFNDNYCPTNHKGTKYVYRIELTCIDKCDLLRGSHIQRFNKSNSTPHWRIESVKETGRTSKVFCCHEPLTGFFTVSDNVLSGNCDTDSIYVTTEDTNIWKKFPIPEDAMKKLPPNPSEKLLSAVAIVCQLRENIPSGAKLDLEAVNKILFIPPVETQTDFNKSYKVRTQNGIKLIKKILSENDEVVQFAVDNFGGYKVTFDILKKIAMHFDIEFPKHKSIKKNYIKLEWNPKESDWKISGKGKFVKRNATEIERVFQKTYLKIYSQDAESAEEYYNRVIEQLSEGNYDISELTITRKIGVGEKTLVELGFGKEHDTVSYWIGENQIPTQQGGYDPEYYVKKVKKMYEEFTVFRDLSVPKLKEEDIVTQLSLFD